MIRNVAKHKDIKDIETRFYTSTYELDIKKGKKEKVIGLMKGELSGKSMKKVVGLRTNTYSYLIDYGSEDKKAKATKICVMKIKFKFESYKTC